MNKFLEIFFIQVTGGSSGIGEQVAITAARRGAHVVIIARDPIKLESAKSEILNARKFGEKQRVECISLDISESYEKIEKTFDDLEEKLGPIYMLVNCAGSAVCGKIEDTSAENLKFMTDLNYISSYYCTKAVVPRMKKENKGVIVLTSSHAGLLGK